MQTNFFNAEDSLGDNLDRVGAIVGRVRLIGQGDFSYYNSILAQIYKNVCDGTVPKLLKSLLVQYNLKENVSSKSELRITRGSRSTLNVHVRDSTYLDVFGGISYIEDMVSAGSQVFVTVSDIPEGGDFVTEGDDGWGFGSLYEEDEEQGALVDVYSADSINILGITTGTPLPITHKKIPVSTFE